MSTPVAQSKHYLTLEFLARPSFIEPFSLEKNLEAEGLSLPASGNHLLDKAKELKPYKTFLEDLLSKRWRKKPLFLLKTDHRLLEGADKEEEKYERFALSALVQLLAGEYDRAEECILKAAELRDDLPLHHQIYAFYHGLNSEPDQALFELHLAIERLPEAAHLTRIFAAQKAFEDFI